MKVALVHYWLVGMRGGERVLEELVRLYPDADLFTHVADPDRLSPLLANRPITESFIARLPGAKRHYQKYLGLMPRALEELDLSGYDLVISSESGPAKGVIVPPGTPHICYVHTPMRYIWDHYVSYSALLGRVGRMYFSRLAHRLRIWDVTTAARVDHFVANSNFVAERIRRFYRRDADVVHPPVDLDAYRLPNAPSTRAAYLFVSQLVPYKRADLVIEAFRGLDHPLLVVGDGSQRAELERNLPRNVTLLGKVPAADLPGLYQNARALIFPAEEDFGIVPVEAMACGTPVLAYGRGGALDSVIDGKTGLFFDDQSPEAIREAVLSFETRQSQFDPEYISAHAAGFGAERFRREFSAVVERVIASQSGKA
ncbi:glycosyltransferase [Ruegeria marina]|uniref:Glycosyltransferase involved in cell wall bisynthesis n=1 Tax=Ruegeria marina TaxID=639004 RepID=A0A1G6IBQ4_9RHOB|nr:glycosyltransferase [Ruegeria marina]SDC03969.1 Glycosyltransferase involved in cell wall bisynthesis [Ruegeria marina]